MVALCNVLAVMAALVEVISAQVCPAPLPSCSLKKDANGVLVYEEWLRGHQKNDHLVQKDDGASITGNTEDKCCDERCSTFNCPSGKHLKDSPFLRTGSTEAECCLDDITGKCAGNTDSAEDFTCGTGKVLKYNAGSITGSTEAQCCDTACSTVTCSSGTHLVDYASSTAGSTEAACCSNDITGKCTGNTDSTEDFTCPSGKHLIDAASITAGSTAAACCEDDITGKCEGNTDSKNDFVCQKVLLMTCEDFDCSKHCDGCTASSAINSATPIAQAASLGGAAEFCGHCCTDPSDEDAVNDGEADGAMRATAVSMILAAALGFSGQ